MRRKLIRKANGKMRPLGIPTVRDRAVQAAVLLVLEPIFEADFEDSSYGFRPRRSAEDALRKVAEHLRSGRGDRGVRRRLAVVFGSIFTLHPRCRCLIEEVGKRVQDIDPQAFASSAADMDGLELAALDTLQHRLAGDAQDVHGVEHGYVAFGRLLDEARAQLFAHAYAPGCTGCELLTSDESVVDAAVQRGGRYTEDACRLSHADQLAQRRLGRWLEAGDLPVGPQAANSVGREAQLGGGPAALAVEDAGDDGVGIVSSEAAHQLDRLLVGAIRSRLGAWQCELELADETAEPAQRQVRLLLVPIHVDDDLLDQGAQQLLAVAVGGGRRRPDTLEVGSQGQDGCALLSAEGSSAAPSLTAPPDW